MRTDHAAPRVPAHGSLRWKAVRHHRRSTDPGRPREATGLRPQTRKEHRMHSLGLSAAALLISGGVLSAGGAQAVGLDVLVAGGNLTDGDITFDGFTYNNAGAAFGGLGIGAGDIDVTLSTNATTATLLFDFVPDVALGLDA